MNDRKGLIKKILSVPVLGTVLRISNAYAYKGDQRYLFSFASSDMWAARLGKGLVAAVLLASITFAVGSFVGVDKSFNASSVILSTFPSILGFGIGAFALIFVLPNSFFRLLWSTLKKAKQNGGGDNFTGARMLPVDMAYPLLVYCIIMMLSAFIGYLEKGPWLGFFSFFLLMYGFVVTFELLSTIFSTAYRMMVEQDKLYSKE